MNIRSTIPASNPVVTTMLFNIIIKGKARVLLVAKYPLQMMDWIHPPPLPPMQSKGGGVRLPDYVHFWAKSFY